MRQCLSCSTQFDEALANCTNCGGLRSFVVAGTAKAAGAGGNAVGIPALGDLWKAFLSPEWTPNGVLWAGMGMLAVEIPSVIGLWWGGWFSTGADIITMFLTVISVVNLGLGVALFYQQEWAFWPARITMSMSMWRHFRMCAIYFALGLQVGGMMHLVAALVMICNIVLLLMGYAHPKSPIAVRFQLPIVVVFWILMITTLATGSDLALNGTSSLIGEDEKALAKAGITRQDGGRVVDSVLCCSWVPPKKWIVSTSEEGDAGGMDAISLEEMENISLVLDFPEGSVQDEADHAAKEDKRELGMTTTSERFSTPAGISGIHVHGENVNTAVDDYFLPGRGGAVYHLNGVGRATAATIDQVANSFRLERGTPEKPENLHHHHHQEDEDEAPANPPAAPAPEAPSN